jgi:ABC-type metal ion transport system substrate-binding protein
MTTNIELLEAALTHVESESIRAWANSDHNRPVWEKIAQQAVDNKGDDVDPITFSTYILCEAMGL